jgi:hypothetical protein
MSWRHAAVIVISVVVIAIAVVAHDSPGQAVASPVVAVALATIATATRLHLDSRPPRRGRSAARPSLTAGIAATGSGAAGS